MNRSQSDKGGKRRQGECSRPGWGGTGSSMEPLEMGLSGGDNGEPWKASE